MVLRERKSDGRYRILTGGCLCEKGSLMEGEEGSQGVDLCEAKVIKRKGEESS